MQVPSTSQYYNGDVQAPKAETMADIDPITSVIILTGDTCSLPTAPATYTIVNVDLNKNALSGKYIYILLTAGHQPTVIQSLVYKYSVVVQAHFLLRMATSRFLTT